MTTAQILVIVNAVLALVSCLMAVKLMIKKMKPTYRYFMQGIAIALLSSILIYIHLNTVVHKETTLQETTPRENKPEHVYIDKVETYETVAKMERIMVAIRINNFTKNTKSFVDFACASEFFVTECPNAGLGGLLLKTIDHINFCEKLGATPTVFWRQCVTVCPSDPSINAWSMFFMPINPNIETTARKVICLGSTGGLMTYKIGKLAIENPHLIEKTLREGTERDIELLSFKPRKNDAFSHGGLITKDIRLKTNQIIRKYIKVQSSIQSIVDQFYSRNLDKFNVVAVHVRGTDHGLETDDGLVSLNEYIKTIRTLIDNDPSINRIFVASDNSQSIKVLVKEFGHKVVYTQAVRAKAYDGPPVHGSGIDPYKLGSQVLIDILLMSKCKYFVHVESSVAALVTFFNPHIKSYFVGHKQIKERAASKVPSNPGNNVIDRGMRIMELPPGEDKLADSYKCFQQNRLYSVCSNFHKGLVVRFRDILSMKPDNVL